MGFAGSERVVLNGFAWFCWVGEGGVAGFCWVREGGVEWVLNGFAGSERVVLNGRSEEPFVEVADVEIGADFLNIDGKTSDCVSGVNEGLVHALLSSDFNELAYRNKNRRH
ncbi:hypothetical protein SO802_023445 [Lithocarpus litseifolius]|uniref:Uncharacterized protein n=1 Tax=Lithocarpus litseifolius TaxID=425828 RepID=A0AAW2C879_9ROSI